MKATVSRRVALAVALVMGAGCAGLPGGGIPAGDGPPRVDGAHDEWTDETIVATNGRAVPGPDLREVRAFADAEALHLLFTFERPVNLQSMAATLRLALDADADPATGERVAALVGADIIIDFSALQPGDAEGSGMRVRFAPDSAWRSPYDVALAYAPTHAATSFEVDVARIAAGREILPGRVLEGLALMLDGEGLPIEVFGPFTIAAPAAQLVGPAPAAPFPARAAITDLRVLAWNVGDDTPLRRPEPYRRVLAAAAPDVVLLDELNPAIDEATLRGLLPPDRGWTVVIGTGGGRQRTAVASHLPLEPSPTLARVPWPDSVATLIDLPMLPHVRVDLRAAAADDLPATGAVATAGGVRILFVPLDMPCCGRAGSAEDRARVMTALALNEAIRTALSAGEADAVVVGGDLNLVGSVAPLEVLRAGIDAGDDLEIAELLTPDARSFSTWRAPGPFPPGRLDWILFSGSRLEAERGAILDLARVAPAVLDSLGLSARDTEVTDHLPVITDFVVRPAGNP